MYEAVDDWKKKIVFRFKFYSFHLFFRVMNGEEEINHMKRTVSSHHLTFEAKALQPHLEYQFWVSATTKVGEGPSSEVATQILSIDRRKRRDFFTIFFIIKGP